MHGPMAIILPIFMLGFLTRFYGKNKSWSEGFAAWQFCVFAAVAFLVPYLTFAWLVGPEFPSLIGGLVGLGIIVAGAKAGFCMPKDTWGISWSQSTWDASWTGTIATKVGTEFKPHMSQFKAWLPYILIGAILVVTRVPSLGLKAILAAQKSVQRSARLQGRFRLHRLPLSARHDSLYPGRHPDHLPAWHEG